VNVFVLCTGRCGSHTFIKACSHITNFTAGHEARVQECGPARLAYPENHIEADNRLSWFLGRLDERYGSARYVHLTRDPEATARSLAQYWSWQGSMATAYRNAVLRMTDASRLDACRDQVATINANIRLFLKDKEWMPFRLEHAREDWPRFWEWIGAEGDYAAALAEWATRHNATRRALARRYHIAKHLAGRLIRLHR
jgi:hypothetical protein